MRSPRSRAAFALVLTAALLSGGFVFAQTGAASKAPLAKQLRPWKGATPPLALRDADRTVHDLKAYRGKVVLVNFWASWCEPCLQEMPSIEDLQSRMKGRPFEVLAVNFAESEERVAAFLNNYGIHLKVLYDKDMAVSKRWNARILPATFLIGADGRIRYSVLGEADWTSPPFSTTVDTLVAEAEKAGRNSSAR